jgi:hypothetical protein
LDTVTPGREGKPDKVEGNPDDVSLLFVPLPVELIERGMVSESSR